MKKIFNKVRRLLSLEGNLKSLSNDVSLLQTQMNIARSQIGNLQSRLNENMKERFLDDIKLAEFKVFSQWGDDGIIQFLVNYLDIKDKRFVEFGVENYTECNTRFLLINNNWSGLVMDGSSANIEQVQKEDIYWKHDLTARAEFVTAENINELLSKNGFTGEIGLLHIDVDGNDYWIWKAIEVANPVIIIVEYNSVFGYDKPWTIPYKSDFVRTNVHFSNLYFGASVLSFCDLGRDKGYAFIGCNSNGNNAYFIRKDKLQGIKEKSPKDGFVLSRFSESRNDAGHLTFVRGEERLEIIKGLSVYNTRDGVIEKII